MAFLGPEAPWQAVIFVFSAGGLAALAYALWHGVIGQLLRNTVQAVEAVVGAIREVRAKPSLLAWVGPGKTGEISEILRESPLIESFTARFVGESEEFPDLDLARWVLRCIVSFLAVPGADEAEERRMIERFLAPMLTVR